MFTLKDFIMKGLINAIGKMADYQIILNAAGWYEKGVLDEADLSGINAAIEDYRAAAEEETQAADETATESEETQHV